MNDPLWKLLILMIFFLLPISTFETNIHITREHETDDKKGGSEYTGSYFNLATAPRLDHIVMLSNSSNEGASKFHLVKRVMEERENVPTNALLDNKSLKRIPDMQNEIRTVGNDEGVEHETHYTTDHVPMQMKSDGHVEPNSPQEQNKNFVDHYNSFDMHDHHHQEMPMSQPMSHMKMFFHQSIMDIILFKGWVPYNLLTYLLSVLCIFFFTMSLQYLKHIKVRHEASCQEKLRLSRKETFTDRLLRAVLDTLESLLSILLMLVAMAYNLGLFLAIILGIFVGVLILGPHTSKYLFTLGQGCMCD